MWLDAALRSERAQEEERGKRETPIHQTLSERTVEQQTRRHLHIRGFCPSLPDKLIKSRDDDALTNTSRIRTRNVRKYDINLRKQASASRR